MKRRFIPLLLTSMALTSSAFTAEASPSFGIVNFGTCVADSKLGKQEQASFESLKTQMANLLEETEKQLTDLGTKWNDPDYRDGLSPEAENELKNNIMTSEQKYEQLKNQYYQVMNQAQMRIVQQLSTTINTASDKVAKDKKLSVILNKDACFYYSPSLDVTNLVIAEMDKTFKATSAVQANAVEASAADQKTEVK